MRTPGSWTEGGRNGSPGKELNTDEPSFRRTYSASAPVSRFRRFCEVQQAVAQSRLPFDVRSLGIPEILAPLGFGDLGVAAIPGAKGIPWAKACNVGRSKRRRPPGVVEEQESR